MGDSADPSAHLSGDREASAPVAYEAAAGACVGVHAWRFTPRTFKAVMSPKVSDGLFAHPAYLDWIRRHETVNESRSRGRDVTPAKKARLDEDARKMRERWGADGLRDPFYSPNFPVEHSVFVLGVGAPGRAPWKAPT